MNAAIKKYSILLLLIALLLFLGYYRDFVFRAINSLLQSKDYQVKFTAPPSLSFLQPYNYSTLTNLKWILTVVFSLAYLIIALCTIRLLFNKKKYLQITIGLYVFILLISGVFMVFGYLFHGISDKMYAFARYLMGMAQSPIILMILIPSFKLSGQERSNIPN